MVRVHWFVLFLLLLTFASFSFLTGMDYGVDMTQKEQAIELAFSYQAGDCILVANGHYYMTYTLTDQQERPLAEATTEYTDFANLGEDGYGVVEIQVNQGPAVRYGIHDCQIHWID